MINISLWVAFTAGIASFLSPCIFPLIPVYLSVLGGGKAEQSRLQLLTRSLGFVLGFTTVFIILGATASFLGSLIHSNLSLLRKLGGIFMVVMGLHVSGLLQLNLLNREARLELNGKGTKLGGSYLMGLAFAFGWTPCIGPVLGAILVYAGTRQTISQGIVLLLFYSFGIAIPLLLVAALADVLKGKLSRFNRTGQIISKLSGLIMIAAGVMLFMNKFGWLIGLFSK